MKKSNLICCCLLLFLFTSIAAAFSPGERVVVIFPQIQLQKGERVVEFDLTVRSGQVIGMNNVPKDWSIELAAEQSSETKITGGCRHGPGALHKTTELPTFAVIVEKPLDPSTKFSAKAKLRVSADFDKTRGIEVAPEKMVIKKGSI
jgi:hypothetical protein